MMSEVYGPIGMGKWHEPWQNSYLARARGRRFCALMRARSPDYYRVRCTTTTTTTKTTKTTTIWMRLFAYVRVASNLLVVADTFVDAFAATDSIVWV